jgi:hypothetical protein
MKFNFAVFVRNNQSLLELVEWLHSNSAHLGRFECSTLKDFIVVLVHDGDYEALRQASQYGIIVVIPRNGGEGR